MNAMKRGKRGIQSIYIPMRSGGLLQRSTGTTVPSVVRSMKRMVRELKDAHRWAILDALTIAIKLPSGRSTFRLSLKEAHAYWSSNMLDNLEAELSAKDLTKYLVGWITWVQKSRRDDVETDAEYWQQVTTLIDPARPIPPSNEEHTSKPFLAPELTKARIRRWLASRDKASSGTLRKYFYALKSFVNYLLDEGVLVNDPMHRMKAPKKNPARERWVTAETDEAIVRDAMLKYQAFFAFVKGVGCDVGAALKAEIDDVNVFAATTLARGTKTPKRRVPSATIEPWALPYIRAQIAARRKVNDGPLLFPGVGPKAASQHHTVVCNRLNVKDYTLKDARHSVGVRMRLAGKTFEEIAAQLGTSVFHVVTVYAKYKPEDVQAKEEAK